MRVIVLALGLASVAGCASGIPTRLETQVRHHYTCGLGTISGHLLSRTEDSETYAVDACGGHHLVVVCPTGARTRFQPCAYESDTGGEGSEVVYGPRRQVDEPPAAETRSDAAVAEATDPVAEPTAEAPADAVPETAAAPGPSAEAAARAAIDGHRAALLACTGGPAALRLTWTGDGQLTIALRDTPDSDEERCIRAAMAGVTIDAGGASGTALHAIAP